MFLNRIGLLEVNSQEIMIFQSRCTGGKIMEANKGHAFLKKHI